MLAFKKCMNIFIGQLGKIKKTNDSKRKEAYKFVKKIQSDDCVKGYNVIDRYVIVDEVYKKVGKRDTILDGTEVLYLISQKEIITGNTEFSLKMQNYVSLHWQIVG